MRTGDDHGVDEDPGLGNDAASGSDGGLHRADVAGQSAEGFASQGHGQADLQERDGGCLGGSVGGFN